MPLGCLPYLDHIARESARLRAALAAAPPGARVPTCPDWDADDLLWHLGEVQWFWGEIAQRRLTDPADLDAMGQAREDRPPERAALLGFCERSSERLVRVLGELSPDTELWMWSDDHSAAYIQRRQAHEALIHRLDAELTVGERTEIDCRLAADGVDEALRVMRGYVPQPGRSHEPLGGTVDVVALDAMHTWTVRPVRIAGTDADGEVVEAERFAVADGPDAAAAAQICGAAADLDCWLWNRPVAHALERDGDPAALAAIDRVVGAAID